MKTRVLGKDLTVSAVSLGCMGFTHAYGTAMDEKEAARVIAQAVELGYLYFDTAECYIGERADGSTAYNEDLVGAALKPWRHQVVIATKSTARDKETVLKQITHITEKYPLVASLIVPGEELATARVLVKTPGNLLYVNYRKLAKM